MDYGLQLGRRFRALKLWFVLEHYGTERLGKVIASHVDLANDLARHIEQAEGYELAAPQSLSVVVFRKVVQRADGSVDEEASERANEELMTRINESGRAFVSQTRLRGRYVLRVAIGNGATRPEHVDRLKEFLQ